MSTVADAPLTPVIKIDTKVPTPNRSFSSVNSDLGLLFGDGNKTIQLNACSEFVNHPMSTQPLDAGHKLRIIQDASMQPAIFTRGSNDRLYCTVHVEGGPSGWQSIDITPLPKAQGGVKCFDVMKTIDGRVVICTAFADLSGEVAVYHCTISNFSCSWDSLKRAVQGLDPERLPWKRIENNLGQRSVSDLSLAPSSTSSPPFQIIAVTETTATYAASHFILDPTFGAKNAWRLVKLGSSVAAIRETYPANLWTGNGIFTLFQYPGRGSACVFDSLDNGFHYKMRLDEFGDIRSIYPNQNPWNMTDLLVATERGVAFCNFAAPDMRPQYVLAGIGIKQIVSHETIDTDAPDLQTKLAIFALSDNNELYYVEAWRPYATNILRFRTSGLPMASNVARVSTQYNAAQDATELIYIGDGENEIYHAARTLEGWSHNRITVKPADGSISVIKHPAYVTALTLTNNAGTSIGGDYPVLLSSKNLVRVTVNGHSRTIGPKPATFLTDGGGCIRILALTDGSLVGPEYTLTLFKFVGQPREFQIHSAQRVLRILAKVNDKQSLVDAKSTHGQQVFDASDPRLDDCAALLGNFHSMYSSVDPKGSAQVTEGLKAPDQSKDVTVGYSRTQDGKVQKDNGSWIDEAKEALEHTVADVLAFIRKAVKVVAKFAIRIIGPVVTFFFKIAGKVIRFVAKKASALLQSVVHFIDEYLGLHLSDFLNWLSFIFDVEKTKETQTIILEVFTHGRELMDAQMHQWGDSIDKVIDDARSNLSKYVKDDRATIQSRGDKPGTTVNNPVVNEVLSFFLHNPIASLIEQYNPMTLLMNAVTGGVEDAFAEEETDSKNKIDVTPKSIWAKVMAILADFFVKEGENFVRLVQDIQTRVSTIVKDFSKMGSELVSILGDAFWTMFDAVKILIQQVWKLVTELLDAIMGLLAQELNIPLIAEFWKDFAGQPFSLLNIFSYLAAQVLNIISLCKHGKLPFEAWGDPRDTMRALVATTRPQIKADSQVNGKPTRIEAVSSIKPMQTKSTETEEEKRAREKTEAAEAKQSWNNWSNVCGLLTTSSTLVSAILGCLTIANASSRKETLESELRKMREEENKELPDQPLIERLRNDHRQSIAFYDSWASAGTNAMFAMDAIQITARVTALSRYSRLLNTVAPFKKNESWALEVTSQTSMLASAVLDCVARAVNAAIDGGRFEASPENAAIRTHWQKLKALDPKKRDGICDSFAVFNCTVNTIGSIIACATSDDGSNQQKANGCGIGSGFGMVSLSACSAAAKFAKPNTYTTVGMWAGGAVGIGCTLAQFALMIVVLSEGG